MSDQASIPDTCTVEGHLLASNGTGMRRLFLVNVYKAVLFSAEPVRQPSDLFEASKPLRIHFEYLYGPISRDRIAAAWEGALFKAIGEAHADAIKSFIDTITDYQRGDQVHYDLLPGGEIRVVKNGQACATLQSPHLGRGILDLMFGERPIDEKLKAGMVPELSRQKQAA